jgi:hypothetical protein
MTGSFLQAPPVSAQVQPLDDEDTHPRPGPARTPDPCGVEA